MKPAGVRCLQCLTKSRAQWGWCEMGAAGGGVRLVGLWLVFGGCHSCCVGDTGWDEGRCPLRQGLKNHSLAWVKGGGLAWAGRMGCVTTFGETEEECCSAHRGTSIGQGLHPVCTGSGQCEPRVDVLTGRQVSPHSWGGGALALQQVSESQAESKLPSKGPEKSACFGRI